MALGCAVLWFSSATALFAGPIGAAAGFATVLPATTEPFGMVASAVVSGPLNDKWLELAHRLDDEGVQLALCDGDRERCASTAALRFLAIVDQARARDGRARLGEINRAINLAIRPVSDLAQYGEVDVWSSPLSTLRRGAGDCEDYAIAKYVALRQAGMAADDLRIIIFRDTIRGEDHAAAAARLDGHWLILDNQRMAMVDDANARSLRPLFIINDSGISKYDDRQHFATAQLAPERVAASRDPIAIAE